MWLFGKKQGGAASGTGTKWPEFSKLPPWMQQVVSSAEWAEKIEGWAPFLYTGEPLEEVYTSWIIRQVRCDKCGAVSEGRLAWQPHAMAAWCPACGAHWASEYRAKRTLSWPSSLTMNDMDAIAALAAERGLTWEMLMDDLLWEAGESSAAVAGSGDTLASRLRAGDWPTAWSDALTGDTTTAAVAARIACNLRDLRTLSETDGEEATASVLEARIKQIGQWALETGGVALMAKLAEEVERLGARSRDCEYYWQGIGDWRY